MSLYYRLAARPMTHIINLKIATGRTKEQDTRTLATHIYYSKKL